MNATTPVKHFTHLTATLYTHRGAAVDVSRFLRARLSPVVDPEATVEPSWPPAKIKVASLGHHRQPLDFPDEATWLALINIRFDLCIPRGARQTQSLRWLRKFFRQLEPSSSCGNMFSWMSSPDQRDRWLTVDVDLTDAVSSGADAPGEKDEAEETDIWFSDNDATHGSDCVSQRLGAMTFDRPTHGRGLVANSESSWERVQAFYDAHTLNDAAQGFKVVALRHGFVPVDDMSLDVQTQGCAPGQLGLAYLTLSLRGCRFSQLKMIHHDPHAGVTLFSVWPVRQTKGVKPSLIALHQPAGYEGRVLLVDSSKDGHTVIMGGA